MYYSIPLTAKELSQRKLEEYEKFCTVIQAGRKNPVWFIENFFGVKLPDYQKMVLDAELDKAVCYVAVLSWCW